MAKYEIQFRIGYNNDSLPKNLNFSLNSEMIEHTCSNSTTWNLPEALFFLCVWIFLHKIPSLCLSHLLSLSAQWIHSSRSSISLTTTLSWKSSLLTNFILNFVIFANLLIFMVAVIAFSKHKACMIKQYLQNSKSYAWYNCSNTNICIRSPTGNILLLIAGHNQLIGHLPFVSELCLFLNANISLDNSYCSMRRGMRCDWLCLDLAYTYTYSQEGARKIIIGLIERL